MEELFFKYYGLFVGSIILFYVIGIVVLLIFQIKKKGASFYEDVFSKLIVGAVTFVFINSVYFTKGKTINLGFLIVGFSLLILYYREQKKKLTENDLNYFDEYSFKKILSLILFSLLVFLISFFAIYSSDNIPVVPLLDYVNYANLSNFLLAFGKENSSINYIFVNETGVSTYHYFEIWLNVGVSNLYGSNSLLSLLLITFSLGAFVMWIGICALFSTFKTITIVEQFLSFFFLFLTGLTFQYIENTQLFADSGVFRMNVFSYYKLFPVFWFSICSLLLFIKNKYEFGIVVLLCIPIVSISTGIGIWSAIFVFLGIQKFVFKKDGMFVGTISFFLLMIFPFLFYKILGKNTQTHVPNSEEIISKVIELFSVKTSVNIIGKTILQLCFLYFPYIVIFFLLFRTANRFVIFIKQNSFILLLLIVFVCALIGWACMYMMLSSVQVFSNIGDVLLNISCILLIMQGLISKEKIVKISAIVVFIIVVGFNINNTFLLNNMHHYYSSKYLKKIYDSSEIISPIGAFMMDKSDYQSKSFSYVSNFMILGSYLAYCDTKTFPISISTDKFEFFGNPFEREYQKDIINSAPFSQYINKQKHVGKFRTTEQSRLDFIEEYKINYLIITKNVELDSLLTIKISMEIVDENTGERFIFLKN